MPRDFDEQKIDDLAAYQADGESFLQYLADEFCAQTERSLKIISDCVLSGDVETLKDHVYALRSPADTLGLIAFAKACTELETTNAQGPALMSLVGRLEEQYVRARVWLSQHTKSVQAS